MNLDNPNKLRLIPIFNPMTTDFSFELFDEANVTQTHLIPSKEIKWFEPPIAERLKAHLADELYHLHGDPKRDRELEMAKIYQEMEAVEDELI